MSIGWSIWCGGTFACDVSFSGKQGCYGTSQWQWVRRSPTSPISHSTSLSQLWRGQSYECQWTPHSWWVSVMHIWRAGLPPQRTPVHLWLGWTAARLLSVLTAQHCLQHPTAHISIVAPTVTVLQAWLWSTNIHLKTSCMKKIKTSKKMRAAWLAILRAAQEQSCSSVEF